VRYLRTYTAVVVAANPNHVNGNRWRSDGLKRRRKIPVVGRLYWEYSTPSIDRPSDILDWYSCFADRHIGELRQGARIARAMRSRARRAFASGTEAVA
jgi:hypothetical protein